MFISSIRGRVYRWANGMAVGAVIMGVGFGDLSAWCLIIIGGIILGICAWQLLNNLDKLHS